MLGQYILDEAEHSSDSEEEINSSQETVLLSQDSFINDESEEEHPLRRADGLHHLCGYQRCNIYLADGCDRECDCECHAEHLPPTQPINDQQEPNEAMVLEEVQSPNNVLANPIRAINDRDIPEQPALAQPNSASRFYVFTFNNPGTWSAQRLWEELFFPKGATYMACQLERGQEGTPHFQGYVELERRTRYSTLQPPDDGQTIWFAKRRGTQQQAITYATKPDTREAGPWIFGEPNPNCGRGQRNDIRELAAAIRGQTPFNTLVDDMGPTLARHLRFADRLRSITRPPLRRDPHNPEFIPAPRVVLAYGRTGLGKSLQFWNTYGNDPTFYATPLATDKLWFDGLDLEHTKILLDDFCGAASKIGLGELLRLLDRYPVQVQVKGGFIWWYPTDIFITTNIHPRS